MASGTIAALVPILSADDQAGQWNNSHQQDNERNRRPVHNGSHTLLNDLCGNLPQFSDVQGNSNGTP